MLLSISIPSFFNSLSKISKQDSPSVNLTSFVSYITPSFGCAFRILSCNLLLFIAFIQVTYKVHFCVAFSDFTLLLFPQPHKENVISIVIIHMLNFLKLVLFIFICHSFLLIFINIISKFSGYTTTYSKNKYNIRSSIFVFCFFSNIFFIIN